MHIRLITPAGQASKAGNRATATRWAAFLEQGGHQVQVSVDYHGEPADAMIALHAWRSAEAVEHFRQAFPERPLMVALTGTDIYKFQHSHPEATLASMDNADALIGLHDRVSDDIPARYHPKLRTVLQSASPLTRVTVPVHAYFDVCVVGHLRAEKDALRAAYAVRDLPSTSWLRVIQVGKAHNAQWEQWARDEVAANSRYSWRGEVDHEEVRALMARARLMVMSSVMEGGANVVSEACVAGVPVIASDIPGNRGILGDDYAGYYPAEDTRALRELLLRAEREPEFLETLREQCSALAPGLTPEAESAALNRVVAEAQRQKAAGG